MDNTEWANLNKEFLAWRKFRIEYLAWDIETWSPAGLEDKPREVKLDPEESRIIAIGYRHPELESIKIQMSKKDIRTFPDEEKKIISKFYEDSFSPTSIGFNIFRYDIPTLLYRANVHKISINLTKYRHIDPFWLIPFWLHNTNDGLRFLKNTRDPSKWGNFWDIEKFSRIFIRKVFEKKHSGSRIRTLYERKQYKEIRNHLYQDVDILMDAVDYSKSRLREELLIPVALANIKTQNCKTGCVFYNWVPKTMKRAVPFCTLTGKKIQNMPAKDMTPIEIISLDLPPRDSDFKPCCTIK